MYADDMVLFSETVDGLSLLENLNCYCKKWNLCINVEKSNIVVFRNSGNTKNNEHSGSLEMRFWKMSIHLLTWDFLFITTISTKAEDQSRKAMFELRKKNIRRMSLNIEILLTLFYCYIGGIANYASEIWGTHKGNNIEKVQNDFCKQILGFKNCCIH
jgi:hypothetical protein